MEFATIKLLITATVGVVIISMIISIYSGITISPENKKATEKLETQINSLTELADDEFQHSSISTTLTGENGLTNDLTQIYAKAQQIMNAPPTIQSRPENILYMNKVRKLTQCVELNQQMLTACNQQDPDYEQEECTTTRTAYQSQCHTI